ncbi:MAG: class I SAM-dependent methyltransferase [Pleurocapsa sp. MO_192.B19]|nr:class I SAM-dependent methyltransferase [Pleurocapsa sp. MO_192.B19]
MLNIARKTAKILLPKTTVYHIKRLIEENRFEQYVKTKLSANFRSVPCGPVPPKELIAKTAALDEQELEKQSNGDVYFETGYYSVLRLLQILEHFSINPRTIGSIFELGCGTARLLRHFRCIDGVRLVGSDVNPEMIEWCKANLPEIEFYHNELTPPLSFAQDNSFDFMLASSVFTHIPLDTQELWLAEMQRILRPGGIFICSVLGQNHASLLLGTEEMNKLREKGSYTLTSDDSQATYSTRVGGSAWDVFQTRAEVIRVFGSFFQIVDYIPGGQDFLVLRKPDPAVSVVMNSVPFPAEKI